ncbi:hypothetical protein BLNAU_10657 [Blattamonas nauphoetae]|uniref:Uncharacterized protein n=1 Tax=Blattamonas nauphoetae TaxID=2049346 RepID=A0ABQ9XT13_9EUKA|nr:hypothetical protein BLNAU_10657 [Blattamonas nauphoetae]
MDNPSAQNSVDLRAFDLMTPPKTGETHSLNCDWDDSGDTTLQSLSPILTSFSNSAQHRNAEPVSLLLPKGNFFVSNHVVESSDLRMTGNDTRIRFWDDRSEKKETGKLDGNVVGIETMFVFRNSSICLSSLELDCGKEGVGAARVLGSCVVVSLCSIRSNMECSPFVVCWMGETDWSSITVTSSSHVSSCSPSLLPLVGICDDTIRSGKTGTASDERLDRNDRSDRTDGWTPSVSITGSSIEFGDCELILGTGPLIGSLDRAGNEVPRKSVSTSLVGCVLVNMTSRYSSELNSVGSWFGQWIVGSVVSSCSNHLYGTSIRSLNGGGSLLSLNSSFVSCLLDATNENKPFKTHTNLTTAHSLFTFKFCTFKGCSASNGGAILCQNIKVNLNIESCSFDSCSANGNGGAIYISPPSGQTNKLTLRSSSFMLCSAKYFACLRMYYPSVSTISECVFIDSEVEQFGGALGLDEWDPVTKGGAISNCLFQNCKQTDATSAYGGGAMFLQQCPSVQLSSLLFDDCSAAKGRGHAIYFSSSTYPTLASMSISNCASSSKHSTSLVYVSWTGKDFTNLLNQSPTTITLTDFSVEVAGTTADVKVTLDKAVSGTLLVVVSNVGGERQEVTNGIPNIGRVLEFSIPSSSSIGSCSVSIGETGLLQTPLSDYSIVATFLPGHIISFTNAPIVAKPETHPILRLASCSLDASHTEAIVRFDGTYFDVGNYNLTFQDESSLDVELRTDADGKSTGSTSLGVIGSDPKWIEGTTWIVSKVESVSNPTMTIDIVHPVSFTIPTVARLSGIKAGELDGSTKGKVTLSFLSVELEKGVEYTLTLVGQDSAEEELTRIITTSSSGEIGEKEEVLYPFETEQAKRKQQMKFGVLYKVTSLQATGRSNSVQVGSVRVQMPQEPTRIISALGSLDTETGKTAEITLTGIGFPPSTDFTILVRELDALSQPTGSPIELSSSFAAGGSSTSHTMTTPIFGTTVAKLEFEKSYVITDLLISGMSTVVDSDVTFVVPAEPSRLISIDPATYSNQDREVSVSLSGVKLSGTYWIVLESNTSAPDVNVSVSFTESGIGELKGILYSKALPLSMNMTYDTVYKIVGMEDSPQNPIFFESGLTFFTMKEPTRIEDELCRMNSARNKVIVSLTGRVLSPGDYSVVLTHTDPSKTRTITGRVNSDGNVECSHTVDANEANSLVFGETYSISSAHRDGTPIHVTSGLTLQIPHPPKVTEAIVHPNTLNTAVTIELLGTGLDLQGNYSVVLVGGLSFTILFDADNSVTSPPLLIGYPDSLKFDTNYTLKSLTNIEPEHDTVLLDNLVWFKTGVKPTNLTLHVDENTGSDGQFCGESNSPCATVDIAWTLAADMSISKVEMKVKNSTTQSSSLVIPSKGFLILSKDQLAGPILRIPSAASMGDRKGMIEVKEATLQISDILVLIESVSDSFVFVFGDSSSVLLTSCSIVGSAQTSNSEEWPEGMCSWSSGSFRLVDCTTTIDTAKLTHLSQGAINMEGGHLSIEAGSFHDNTPSDSAFPSFRRNVHCLNAGHITIENLNGGDGSKDHPSPWISLNHCTISGGDAQPDTPLFIPTLSSDSKSTLDKKSKVFSIEISGSVLIPCGLWLEIVEITKSKTEGNTTQLELTSETCKSLTENLISLELPPSLVKDLDSSLEWRGRLIFGNQVQSSTSFVIQKSSADKRSEAMRDNMKWWIPLVIVIIVALLVFIAILVILLRRRKQKKTAKSSEMTEINTMVEDIKFEEGMSQAPSDTEPGLINRLSETLVRQLNRLGQKPIGKRNGVEENRSDIKVNIKADGEKEMRRKSQTTQTTRGAGRVTGYERRTTGIGKKH